ncbi:hypothetical protein R4463_07795 [Acinetobacter baumannii]|uniref:hypothetical protein n=1 Tax=Acinetobacter baumannii TaxID=470 RepID=UPI002341A0B4|nr:hypothetical protein [Acinetobacter baumannii]MDC5406462.1 hypothetical protein [Acinetobacter baumannii]MDV7520449.1 hypothetical protein [Acinetobacter baumannii]MDV7555924.1 hypothetical protein [Acinetobacter baumannii]HEN9589687.1 hypothetical protein [Acinetobacter baumannii]
MNIQSKSYFHTLITNTRFSIDTDVKQGCLELLDFLIEYPSLDLETSFYFDELRKHVSLEVEDDDFIYSVFYLARPEINILKQEFSAWKESVHDFVLFEDKNFILEMLRDKNYVNPFSGEDLSSEEFEEQVLTFFTPTSYFLEMRNVRI